MQNSFVMRELKFVLMLLPAIFFVFTVVNGTEDGVHQGAYVDPNAHAVAEDNPHHKELGMELGTAVIKNKPALMGLKFLNFVLEVIGYYLNLITPRKVVSRFTKFMTNGLPYQLESNGVYKTMGTEVAQTRKSMTKEKLAELLKGMKLKDVIHPTSDQTIDEQMISYWNESKTSLGEKACIPGAVSNHSTGKQDTEFEWRFDEPLKMNAEGKTSYGRLNLARFNNLPTEFCYMICKLVNNCLHEKDAGEKAHPSPSKST